MTNKAVVAVKKPQLSRITSEAQVLPALNNLTTAMQLLAGQNKDKLERAVTFKDLQRSGFTINGLTGDGGSVVPPIDGGDDPDVSTPPAMTGVRFEPTLDSVLCFWNPAGYKQHAYVEVWIAAATKKINDIEVPTVLDDAHFYGTCPTTAMVISVLPGDSVRIWVRNVGQNTRVGPWFDIAGSAVKVPDNPSYLLDKISGEIRETHLYKTLGEKIDNSAQKVIEHGISLIAHTQELDLHTQELDLHGSQLLVHSTELARDYETLVSHSNTISAQGNSISSLQSVVTGHGTTIATHETSLSNQAASISSIMQINSAQDVTIASYGQTLSTHGSSINNLSQITTDHGNTLATHSSSISSLNSSVTSISQINETQNTTIASHATLLNSHGTSINNLSQIVTDHGTTLATHSSSISSLNSSVTSISQINETQNTTIASHATLLNSHGSSINNLSQITTDHGNTLATHSSSISSLNSSVTSISQVNTTQDTTIASHATLLSSHGTSINNLSQITTDHGTTLATYGTSIASLNSSVVSLSQVNESQNATLASHTNVLSSHGSSIQSLSTITTEQGALLDASYSLRIDTGGAVHGFGLAVDGTTNRSNFIIRADRFAIAAPQQYDVNGKPIVQTAAFPFIVDVTDPNNPKTLIKNAYISNAYIETLIAGKVNASFINAMNLSAVNISGGQITIGNNFSVDVYGTMTCANGVFKGTAQSSNFASGSAGWRLLNSGNAEFNNAIVRGTVYATDGWFKGTVYAEKLVGDVVGLKSLSSQIASGSNFTISFTVAAQPLIRDVVISGIQINVEGYTQSGGSGTALDYTRSVRTTFKYGLTEIGAFNASATGEGRKDSCSPCAVHRLPANTRGSYSITFTGNVSPEFINATGAIALVTKVSSATFE